MKKLTTVKRKANVGELIRIVAADSFGHYENGDIAEVESVCETYPETLVYVNKWRLPVHIDEYVVLEEVDVTNTRLSEAEAKIAALEAEVETMKCQVYSLEKNKADTSELAGINLRDHYPPSIVEMMELGSSVMAPRGHSKSRFVEQLINPEPKTPSASPNQRRADVIKRAQAFVADLKRRAGSVYFGNYDGNELFNVNTTKLEFHVNTEKGVVTALAKGVITDTVYGKAFAKCHPNDVFNADIGKAIAAGKLYGVNYTMEFEYAPQPTYANGQIITFPKDHGWFRKVIYRVDNYANGHGDLTVVYDAIDNDVGLKGHLIQNGVKLPILEDTDAVYP